MVIDIGDVSSNQLNRQKSKLEHAKAFITGDIIFAHIAS